MTDNKPMKKFVIKKKTIITRPKGAIGSSAKKPEQAAEEAQSELAQDEAPVSDTQATPIGPETNGEPTPSKETLPGAEPAPEETVAEEAPAQDSPAQDSPVEEPAPAAAPEPAAAASAPEPAPAAAASSPAKSSPPAPPLARTDKIAPPARPETLLQELPSSLGKQAGGADKAAPIKFFCIRCGQKLAVPAAGAGKKILCPNCRNPITVPPPLD